MRSENTSVQCFGKHTTTLFALLLLTAALAEAQVTCRHDGDCTAGEVCAVGFGERFGLTVRDNVCVAPGSLAPRRYRSTVLGAVDSPIGALDSILGLKLNRHGQVTGSASAFDSSSEINPTAAFRFTPGRGTQLLDPRGELNSSGVLINDNGDVFGMIFGPKVERPDGYTRILIDGYFIHREGVGFDLMERGQTQSVRRNFHALDMNDAGQVVGRVFRRETGKTIPFLYKPAAGWINLASRHAPLRGGSFSAEAINNAGDMLLTGYDDSSSPLRTFLRRADGRLLRLGDLGSPNTYGLFLNEAGQVSGFSDTPTHSSHAFLFARGKGLVDVHRGSTRGSSPFALSESGVVAGVTDRVREADRHIIHHSVFTFDARRFPKVRTELRRGQIRELLPEETPMDDFALTHMNDRTEFLGFAFHVNDDHILETVQFFYSPPTGLVPIAELPGLSAVDGRPAFSLDFNDRGQLMLRVVFDEGDVPSGTVILTPVSD